MLNISWPSVWSVYNDGPHGEIWIFPVPSQGTEIELDATVLPKPIYSDQRLQPIPPGFQDALVFSAAKYAFMSRGRYAQAEAMEAQFAGSLGIDRVAVDRGKTPSMVLEHLMALHDHVASTVALARLLRDGLDDRESVSIKAGTLRLILDVLIEVGDPPVVAPARA